MKEVYVKNQTHRSMTLKWSLLVLVQYEIIVITTPSITGVTYMDHFDFEERYRDANECNPFYWHPLHLPAYCANVFEKLIRSRIASKTPVRITRKREKKEKKKKRKDSKTEDIYSLDPTRTSNSYTYPENNFEFPFPIYEITSAEYESYSPPHTKPLPMTPYEELLALLKEDIKKGPSSPTVTVMPNLGPVALYNQGVSKKSVNLIRQMAEAYVKETKKSYDAYYAAYGNYPSEPQLYVYDSAKNKTETEKEKKKKDKKDKKKKDKNKVFRVKTKHGGVVTIIETKNVEMMKNNPEGFML